tara:strand:- start:1318 stop:2277 length:960 start_codon:yes stop_codon:yes gene_type:complete
MKIGIFVRSKYDSQYKEIKFGKTMVLPEIAVLEILKKKYGKKHEFIIFDAHKFNKAAAKKCDVVWFGFEDFSNILKEQIHVRSEDSRKSLNTYNKTINSIVSTPNIYPNKEFLTFVHDKCIYYDWLKNNGIRVAPTYCVNTNDYSTRKVMNVMKSWSETMFKPVLGGESKGLQFYKKPYKASEITEYFKDAKKAQYPAVILQEFIPNFSTKKFPEIRTVWAGETFVYAALTYGWGYELGLTKRIDPKIKNMGVKIIKLLQDKFKFSSTTIRIDFGKTPKHGIFVNELELGYGTFADVNNKVSKQLPTKIASTFAKIHKL